MLTVIIYHVLDILHDLDVSTMSYLCHFRNGAIARFENTSGLGVQHKRYREKPFDPFYNM